MASTATVWNGSYAEWEAVQRAVANNCDCTSSSPCEPHQMLATSQRVLDGLLFARHLRQRLCDEEVSTDHRPLLLPLAGLRA